LIYSTLLSALPNGSPRIAGTVSIALTEPVAYPYNTPQITSWGLSMAGHVRCAVCETRRNEAVCPRCGSPKCYIYVYWKGKEYKFRRFHVDGGIFDYPRAIRQLTNMRTEMDKRSFNPSDWLPQKIRERKFEHQIELWITQKETEERRDEFSPETLKNYRGYARHHFTYFHGFDVREIRREQLEGFKDTLSSSLRIKTRKNIMNALHAFFNWMYRRETIEKLPAFPTVEGDDSVVRVALDYEEQMEGLLKIPEEHRDVIEFGFETGLRPGELCALKVKDLDMRGQQALIQRTWSGSKLRETTKGKTKRFIPLSDRAFQIAGKHIPDKHPEAFLFVNPKTMNGYRPKTLNNVWKAFSGLQTVHYEASRHSFCTQIVESGADVLQARELMRHTNIRSTQKYFHGSIKRLRDIVNQRGKIVSFRNPSGKAQEA